MVIPIYSKPEFKVGDIIISLYEITLEYCKFTQYHEFTIISYAGVKGYRLKDNELGIEFDTYPINGQLKNFTLKTDIKTAKKRNRFVLNRALFNDFIVKNCPNIDYDYDGHERYDSCQLKKSRNNCCIVSEECINHISPDVINKNKFIVKYLRNKKIEKLEKSNDNE